MVTWKEHAEGKKNPDYLYGGAVNHDFFCVCVNIHIDDEHGAANDGMLRQLDCPDMNISGNFSPRFT